MEYISHLSSEAQFYDSGSCRLSLGGALAGKLKGTEGNPRHPCTTSELLSGAVWAQLGQQTAP